jgi:hypothetical protein
MLNEIITIYAITDDLLKAIGHKEDYRRLMNDAEIITTALTAAMFFDGNQAKACAYMKDHNLIPKMLEKSRFNRRLHAINMLLNDLFHQLGMILKETALQVMRKKNSKRQDKPWVQYIKQSTRHYIETVFGTLTSLFPKSIHVTAHRR